MNATVRAGIHKVVIALCHLWFWSTWGDWFEAYVYARDLDTHDTRLQGKRIKVTIEIEDDPTMRIRE